MNQAPSQSSLAIDWSSRILSTALRTPDGIYSVRREVERFDGPVALTLLRSFLEERNAKVGDLREVRIGRGPGAFSGIRLSFAWAFGAAAPGGVAVYARSSTDVLAAGLLRDGVRNALILGDARRGLWWGVLLRDGQTESLEVHPPPVWIRKAEELPVFSPDASRLGGLANLEMRCPDAEDLLHLPGPSQEAAPLYLHAAVAD